MSFKDYAKQFKKDHAKKQSTKLLKQLEELMKNTIPTTGQQVKMIDLKTRFEEDLEKLRTEMLKEQIKIIEEKELDN